MSAKSFGTFIDSEPSTPAYSPRMDHDWDSSTLVLLRPTSSSSEPASPTEPTWDMIVAPKRPQQAPDTFTTSRKKPSIVTREMSIGTRLAAPPIKKVKSARKTKPGKEVTIVGPYQEEDDDEPHKEDNYEVKAPLQEPNENSAAPFGKLASKMKLMLRRRSTGDKKKEKKEKEKDYYDPVEDVHWTEM
jgi:pyruvate dehydrogenase phosphatase